jgi:hypothetical protein
VRLAKDWVANINSADDAAYVRFVKERGPVLLDGPERWLALRDQLRGIQLCGVKSAKADDVELWAFGPNFDSYAIMRFKPGVTEADKAKFVFLSGIDAVPDGAVLPARLPLAALTKAVEARAASRAAKDQFSGAILLAKSGRVLFQQAYVGRLGASACLYRIECPDDEARRRVDARNQADDRSLYIAPATYDALWHRFEPLDFDEACLEADSRTVR